MTGQGGAYATSLTYNASTHDETVLLPSALGVDQLMLALNGAIAARSTTRTSQQSRPSSWSFAVLPGDVNGYGVIDSRDLVAERNQLVQFLPAGTPAIVWADLDGNGVVDMNDYSAVQRRLGTRLPVITGS